MKAKLYAIQRITKYMPVFLVDARYGRDRLDILTQILAGDVSGKLLGTFFPPESYTPKRGTIEDFRVEKATDILYPGHEAFFGAK